MLIELARYIILFALTVVGLQTFLLFPTLWSGGSAVTIKLGFRGVCFTTGLLAFSFVILLSGFVARDFSLAIVFEAFDSRVSPFYALQAFCSTREGYFFTFIIFLAVALLGGFSKKELATYQERGRYLFAGGCLIFSLLVLMLATANPFIRIEDPPFEGLGFNSGWQRPHRILLTFFSFGACVFLTVSFIKTICMHSKGHPFVLPALRSDLKVLFLLICALGTNLMTGFADDGNGDLWQWLPADSLLLSVLLLITGQTVLLFFRLTERVFTNWILCSSFLATSFSNAIFLADEYRLFARSDEDAYFPNPVAALSALAGIVCFFLFLNSVVPGKRNEETVFSLFSRESFAGLFFAAFIAAAISIGTLSLLPALFMFLPDLPLRLLPALIKQTFVAAVGTASVFLFIAFMRNSVVSGWSAIKPKSASVFWGSVVFLICLSLMLFPDTGKTVLYSLPAVLVFGIVAGNLPFKIPASLKESVSLLKSVSSFRYGVFFCAAGFLVFSVSFSCASFNRNETAATIDLSDSKKGDFPCNIERLSEKAGTSAATYRLMCPPSVRPLSGSTEFQWREKELKARFLQTEHFSARLIRAEQIRENTVKLSVLRYPGLQLAGTGLFLICSGLIFLLHSLRKGNPV